jgi:hypothetical protein
MSIAAQIGIPSEQRESRACPELAEWDLQFAGAGIKAPI